MDDAGRGKAFALCWSQPNSPELGFRSRRNRCFRRFASGSRRETSDAEPYWGQLTPTQGAVNFLTKLQFWAVASAPPHTPYPATHLAKEPRTPRETETRRAAEADAVRQERDGINKGDLTASSSTPPMGGSFERLASWAARDTSGSPSEGAGASSP